MRRPLMVHPGLTGRGRRVAGQFVHNRRRIADVAASGGGSSGISQVGAIQDLQVPDEPRRHLQHLARSAGRH
jgi:hypothetical protein